MEPVRAASAPAIGRGPRIDALVRLAGTGRTLADVGTDHGLVPAHAVLSGAFERALAVDVNEAPLAVARATIIAHGVGDRVELLLGDALGALAGYDVDALVLAGLTGRTFVAWCEAEPEVLARLRRVVIQPNGHLTLVRRWAHERGLHLVDECVVEEGGRHFVTCAFEPRRASADTDVYARARVPLEAAFELGPWLIERRDRGARGLYEKERRRLAPLAARGGREHQALLATYELGLHILDLADSD